MENKDSAEGSIRGTNETPTATTNRLGQRHVFHSDAGSPFATLKSRPQKTGKDLSEKSM
ncbi:unnamed protein product [Leuciscus chuanchicus]